MAILIGSFVLFLTEWLRADLVALLVLVSLALSGVVTSGQALSGFSSPAVVTVGGILVLSGGLSKSGVANLIGRQVLRLAGSGEIRMVAAIMIAAGVMSTLMSSVAVAALLLPAVMDIARRTGRAPSKLLMPLSFGSLLGGLTTLIGTLPNILASDALRERGLLPFGVFDFAPLGLAIALSGIAFMALVGRRLLPERDVSQDSRAENRQGLDAYYDLSERTFVMRVPSGSVLAGRSLANSRLGSVLGLHIIAVIRDGRSQLAPPPTTVLSSGDRLLAEGQPNRLKELRGWRELLLESDSLSVDKLLSTHIDGAEFRLASGSSLAGRTLRDLDFRGLFGVNVLAIRKPDRVRRNDLQWVALQPGDTLLVQGPPDRLSKLNEDSDWDLFRSLSSQEMADGYHLHEALFAAHVPHDSVLVGQTLAESRLGEAFDLTVLGIVREETTYLTPEKEELLQGGDTLLLAGKKEELSILHGLQELEIEKQPAPDIQELESEQVGLAEVVLSPHTSLVGKSLRRLHFRDKYGLSVLAVWREGEAHTANLGDMALKFGDALLLFGPREKLKLLGSEPDFLVLTEAAQEVPRVEKAPVAGLVMAGFVLAVVLGWLHISMAAVLGATLMVLTRCLSMEEAYRFIEWKAVILIAGMLPLGIAMQETGAASFLTGGVISALGDSGPLAVIAALFVVTSLATQVIPTAALVVLMAPIALTTATDLDISPHSLMMVVAMSAGASFMSPITHPANVLIMGPGGYRFVDYMKVGLPLTLVVLLVVLLVLPVFWPPSL